MMSTDKSVAVHIQPASQAEERKIRMKFYRAALRGDWKYVTDQDEITAMISENEDTALHIGATLKSCKFARKVLGKLVRLEDLVRTNKSDNTAFCLAAGTGKLELAKEMIEVANDMVKNERYGNLEEEERAEVAKEMVKRNNGEYLAQAKGNNKMSPLLVAVLFRQEEVAYWLYYLTKTSLSPDDRIELLLALIRNGFHELALKLVEEHKELATACDIYQETALHAFAQLPVANQQEVWKRIKRCFNRYYTLQLLEEYNEGTISDQQGLWEKIKKCFNRFLCSIEKQSPEMKLVQRVWELAMDSHDFEKSLEVARKQIFVAAERGNIEFLKILIREYPDLIFQTDHNNYSIFHFAVKYRHVDIFKLIHEIGSVKDFIVPKTDKKGNNILHLAAMLAPPERLHSVSGVALQMQRELLWFEEVKKLMISSDAEAENKAENNQDGNSVDAEAKNKAENNRDGNSEDAEAKNKAENNRDGNSEDAEAKNKAENNRDGNSEDAEAKNKAENNQDGNSGGKTPRDLFIEEHKGLKKDGEKWMKDTANYCMVVAALITTMVFAATLAVPGGTSDETGTPHFLKKSSFKIFIVSDAISLVLSTCSILTFLSILTSRYVEEDFLKPLPRKLLFGLGTLLLSIAAMMVVFCAAIFILFKDGVVWIPILVTAIGSLPVIFFIIQQVYLFIVVLRSTYISSSIFKPGKGTLFFETGRQ